MRQYNVNQGKSSGTIFIPGHGGIALEQWLEDIVYDSVDVSSGAITAGTEHEFFKDIQSKNDVQTDMAEASKLPEGWEFIVMKMGIVYDPLFGDAGTGGGGASTDLNDLINLTCFSFTRFETGNSKVRRRAPTWAFPMGFGPWVTSADGNEFALGIGPPALSRTPNLTVPIRLTSRLNFEATLEVNDQDASGITLTSAPRVWYILYGFVSQPVG